MSLARALSEERCNKLSDLLFGETNDLQSLAEEVVFGQPQRFLTRKRADINMELGQVLTLAAQDLPQQ